MAIPANIDTLVSSRICHDLISPVGAIGNGLELLMEVLPPSPELELIGDSVASATAKLQFFRLCFGQTQEGAMVSRTEMQRLGDGMFTGGRLALEWDMKSADIPRGTVKMMFLLLLCMEGALPLGGRISITENGGRFALAATGKRVQQVEAWQIFDHKPVQVITPALVQFPLALQVSGQLGRQIQVTYDETALRVTL